MMEYETVQNAKDFSKETTSPAPCSNTQTISRTAPTSTLAQYEPEKSSSSTFDPDQPSNESFSKIVQNGTIKMTPLSKHTVVQKKYLLKHRSYSSVAFTNGCTGPPPTIGEDITGAAEWDRIADYTRWKALTGAPHSDVSYWGDVRDRVSRAKNSCMSKVVSDSANSLDLLTTVVEARESYDLLAATLKAAINPLRTAKEALAKVRDVEEYKDKWLSYRYGIMPILFTVQDVMEVVAERKLTFDTHRASKYLSVSYSGNQRPEDEYSYETYKGNIVVRATLKSRYNHSGLRAYSRTTFNPAITAWELVPYSFVVDWFLNVGDWLTAQYFEMGDFALARNMCVSEKHETTLATRVVRNYQTTNTVTYPGTDPFGRAGHTVEWESPTHNTDDIAVEKVYTTYKRELFKPSDIGLQLAFDLNWQRWVDAAALSHGPVMAVLNSLRTKS